ncbi:MAG: DUF1203 domain-containing protein [Pseudomonadota bacterium]
MTPADIRFHPLPDEAVAALRAGGPDAYGAPAERIRSSGRGVPCRCCLKDIPEGRETLLLAHRPFDELQPYAETGPIFLCADCASRPASAAPPPVVAARPEFLVKAYGDDARIRYGTGRITKTEEIPAYCAELLSEAETAFVDLRSSVNNCFICRVTRA